MDESVQTKLGTLQGKALIAAIVLAGASVLCLVHDQAEFFYAYLMGYFFIVGICLGSMGLLMIHHLTGGRWGYGLRRIFEAATRTLPYMVILFIPVLLGMDELYGHWLHPHEHVEVIAKKAAWLNRPAWIARAVILFAIWGAMIFYLNKWSKEQDETGDMNLNRPLRMLSGIGFVIFFLSATVAGWDWGMSLDPAWFSSMYGPLFIICQGLTTFGFSIVMVKYLSRYKPMSEVMINKVYHDIGNLTFAAGILWAYMSIAQYLIIWCGNLPEEIGYYTNRSGTGWNAIAAALALFHFAIPFLILLSRYNKLDSTRLVKMAYWILAMRFVDLYWHVYPAFHPGDIQFTPITLVVPAALVAIFCWAFFGQLKGRPLVPLHDPRFESVPATAGSAAPAEAH